MIGEPFDLKIVHLTKGEHKSPAFLHINPKGKVPALQIDGETLTENVAILSYLNERFPQARLLPTSHGLMDRTHFLADLAFCAATLHPIVSRICVPHILAPGAEAALKLPAEKSMRDYFALIDDKLKRRTWWYGDIWSVLDAYLFWIFNRVEGCGFEVSDFTNYRAHTQRMKKLPAVTRALAREAQALARETLTVEGSTP
ncbi:MAG: glutathione S-transferase family protein [Parvularculaceae bacterium]|nr:glutathione S-transferase family protein [Parvularculaceae bacterium]